MSSEENEDEAQGLWEINVQELIAQVENEVALRRVMTTEERAERTVNSIPEWEELFPTTRKRLSF